MLFVVSGHGVGVVGNVEREVVAGSVIYVPQGAWTGSGDRADPRDVDRFTSKFRALQS